MPDINDQRPDPDALLEKVQREEEKSRRGKLKLFFGASAGVGKTYGMLSAARQLQSQGVDVLVGVVETHGRKETMALTEACPRPAEGDQLSDRVLKEFDPTAHWNASHH